MRAIARRGHFASRADRSSNSLKAQNIRDGTGRAATDAWAAFGDCPHLAEMSWTRMNTGREGPWAPPGRRVGRTTETRRTRMDTGDEWDRRFAKRPLRALCAFAPHPHEYWLESSFSGRKTQT